MEVPEGMNPETFKRLLEDYKRAIPEKLNAMKAAVARLKEHLNPEDLTALRFVVHKTAGNAGTFGYENVSKLCRFWDQKLSAMLQNFPQGKVDPKFFKELEQFISQVEKEFQG